jgi:apolipoprotein D and lipocalin family protein
MKKELIFILAILMASGMKMFPQSDNSGNNNNIVKTVNSVDLKKYAGKWYEIAKIPNRFQKGCVRNTTAEYKLRDDGDINVINRCIETDGSVNEAEGLAKVVDEKTNSKLEVSFVSIFGIHLFWGDYWIIGLDKNYEYAVIGHPERKYGWILNRSPKMSEEKLKEAFEILKENGYDPKDFVTTIQR